VGTRLEQAGLTVEKCRDPGGTRTGDRIRGALLDHDLTDMDVRCEALLFMASRAQLLKEVIGPALKAGKAVLCDRFVSATCAYQVARRARLEDILDLARHAIGDTWLGLTVILDVAPNVGFERIARERGRASSAAGGDETSCASSVLDGMERRSRGFHERVRANSLAFPGRYRARLEVVDGSLPPDAVVDEVMDRLRRFTSAAAPGT
jgi:dTMP kinase